MSGHSRQSGFSLAETLIALGVLTVGMLFIAGVFPVGIHFTYVSIDRTTSAVVADEAFAKVKLYAQRVPDDVNGVIPGFQTGHMRDFNDWFVEQTGSPSVDDHEMYWDDFAYPSIPAVNEYDKQYCWSALCRIVGEDRPDEKERMVQVTVFVSKRTGLSEKYYIPDWSYWPGSGYGIISSTAKLSPWPMPVKVEVTDSDSDNSLGDNELRIDRLQERVLINDGCRVVDDRTGRIYRVMERYPSPDDNIIVLDKDRPDGEEIEYVWVVPLAEVGGKSPSIAVYQKILRF